MQSFLSILLLILNRQTFNAIDIDWSSAKFSTVKGIMSPLQLEFLLCDIVDQNFCVKQSLLDEYSLSFII